MLSYSRKILSSHFVHRRDGLSIDKLLSTSAHPISVQLDYYMGPQFAGLAVAMDKGIYSKMDVDPTFMPTCYPGLEAEKVRMAYDDGSTSGAVVGVTEQNILIDCLHGDPNLNVEAISAMFRQSPLHLLSLSSTSSSSPAKVGCHDDTVELVSRLLPDSEVISVPRATKLDLLMSNEIDAVQIYDTTELVTLSRKHPEMVGKFKSTPFSAYGADLGYGQVIFAPKEALANPDNSESISKFLEATFEGWRMSLRDPSSAVDSIKRVCKLLNLDEEGHTHYDDDSSLLEEIVVNCNDAVAETKEGPYLGVVDADRYNKATKYLLSTRNPQVEENFGLSPTFYQPPPNMFKGCELSRNILDSTKKDAAEILATSNKKPSLTVITVGSEVEGETLPEAPLRRQTYSSSSNSWYSKVETGEKHGIDTESVVLPSNATTEDVISAIDGARDRDGIQLMWPLPPSIDEDACFSHIPVHQDIDGLVPNSTIKPVTVDAVLALLDSRGVEIEGRDVVILGRSKITGSPLSNVLSNMGGTVTLAHASTPSSSLRSAIEKADIVISCVGVPGVVDSSWLKEGSVVVSVGKVFDATQQTFIPDINVETNAPPGLYSSTPGGVGPLSVAILMRNVVGKGKERVKLEQARKSRGILTVDELLQHDTRLWSGRPLARTFHFNSHPEALDFISKVVSIADEIDHHPNVSVVHHCTDGVTVTLTYETYEVKGVTIKDIDATSKIDEMWQEGGRESLRKSDFIYDLPSELIALHPATVRGKSRFLQNNNIHPEFDRAFHDLWNNSLKSNTHIVFNDSRVVKARCAVDSGVELLFLDPFESDLSALTTEATGQKWRVMIRAKASPGDVLALDGLSGCSVEVVSVVAPWIEEDEVDGVDCVVKVSAASSGMTMGEFFDSFGSIPIPPYFNRDAIPDDEVRYQNVFAKEEGSVAAPTAGLHFTDELIKEVEGSASFLTLHVGAGTFKPIEVDVVTDHNMHSEKFSCSKKEVELIIEALEQGKDILAVGTTSARTLESLYWLGVSIDQGEQDPTALTLTQYQAYDLPDSMAVADSLKLVVGAFPDIDVISGSTALMIHPGYRFQVVDKLVTNFHVPDSTLMLMVSAFAGTREIKDIYKHAIKEEMKFLSYGDAMMLEKKKEEDGKAK